MKIIGVLVMSNYIRRFGVGKSSKHDSVLFFSLSFLLPVMIFPFFFLTTFHGFNKKAVFNKKLFLNQVHCMDLDLAEPGSNSLGVEKFLILKRGGEGMKLGPSKNFTLLPRLEPRTNTYNTITNNNGIVPIQHLPQERITNNNGIVPIQHLPQERITNNNINITSTSYNRLVPINYRPQERITNNNITSTSGDITTTNSNRLVPIQYRPQERITNNNITSTSGDITTTNSNRLVPIQYRPQERITNNNITSTSYNRLVPIQYRPQERITNNNITSTSYNRLVPIQYRPQERMWGLFTNIRNPFPPQQYRYINYNYNYNPIAERETGLTLCFSTRPSSEIEETGTNISFTIGPIRSGRRPISEIETGTNISFGPIAEVEIESNTSSEVESVVEIDSNTSSEVEALEIEENTSSQVDLGDMKSQFAKLDEFLEKRKEKLKEQEELLKRRKEEEYKKSEIYAIIRPKMAAELSKIHSSINCVNARYIKNRILRLYTLPIGLPNERYAEAAEDLLGRQNTSLWKEKFNELRMNGIHSSFFKSVADWLIEKNRPGAFGDHKLKRKRADG